jgi:hypothetical protein
LPCRFNVVGSWIWKKNARRPRYRPSSTHPPGWQFLHSRAPHHCWRSCGVEKPDLVVGVAFPSEVEVVAVSG